MCISESKHIPYVGEHSKEHNDTSMLSVSCRVHGSSGLTGGMYRSIKGPKMATLIMIFFKKWFAILM